MERIQRRFDKLAAMADEIAGSMTTGQTRVPSPIQTIGEPTNYLPATSHKLDGKQLNQWYSSVESLLFRVYGSDYPYYKNFTKKKTWKNAHTRFDYLHSIFQAAKDDYEGGYLFDLRSLVHAKVFASELEQAQELLKQGYKAAAAVVTGAVLETTLRECCEQNGIDAANLNRMNDDLAKAGFYNDARKTQVQAWAKIRNNAAHGKPDEFNKKEVENMISGVQNFVANQM